MLECPQCGMIHPPIKEGEKCPMITEKDPNGQVIDYDPLLRPLKNIVSSQIQIKNIKDKKKMFGEIIVIITKYLEDYNE